MDAGGDGLVETKLPCNRRAPLTAGSDEFSREFLAVSSQIKYATHALLQALALAGVGQHETHDLGQMVGVDSLEVALNFEVVGAIELTQTCSVTATTGVLQQQCVVKVPECRGIETKFFTHVHADPATA